jgi:hypothetical protein
MIEQVVERWEKYLAGDVAVLAFEASLDGKFTAAHEAMGTMLASMQP